VSELIEALQIFAKYQKQTWNPTHCEHDVLLVVDVLQNAPSEEDRKRLGELHFFWSSEYGCWASFRFGSA